MSVPGRSFLKGLASAVLRCSDLPQDNFCCEKMTFLPTIFTRM